MPSILFDGLSVEIQQTARKRWCRKCGCILPKGSKFLKHSRFPTKQFSGVWRTECVYLCVPCGTVELSTLMADMQMLGQELNKL